MFSSKVSRGSLLHGNGRWNDLGSVVWIQEEYFPSAEHPKAKSSIFIYFSNTGIMEGSFPTC